MTVVQEDLDIRSAAKSIWQYCMHRPFGTGIEDMKDARRES